jgi:hypothetical protein
MPLSVELDEQTASLIQELAPTEKGDSTLVSPNGVII